MVEGLGHRLPAETARQYMLHKLVRHTEEHEVFDGIVRRELGISGSEFLQRWDAGEYQDTDRDDVDGLSEVIAAMPLVR